MANVRKVDHEQVQKMYADGYSTAEISEATGAKPAYVERLTREQRRAVDCGKIRALWRAGWTVQMIMKDCNVDEETVQRVVK